MGFGDDDDGHSHLRPRSTSSAHRLLPAPVGLTSRKDETTPVRFTIPSTTFVAGINTIAVEVHGDSHSTDDLSFDLRLTGQP